MAKTRPTVLAAIFSVLLLAVLTSGLRSATYLIGVSAVVTQYALPSALTWPFVSRIYAPRLIAFVVQIVLMAAVVLLVS